MSFVFDNCNLYEQSTIFSDIHSGTKSLVQQRISSKHSETVSCVTIDAFVADISIAVCILVNDDLL